MSGKSDCQELMDDVADLADELLKKQGAFRPFGFTMAGDRTVSSIAFDFRDDTETASEIEFVRQFFKEKASEGEYIATALAYDASVTGEHVIAVELDHIDGYSVTVLKPYKILDGSLEYGGLSAQQGSKSIFN